jgi:hypothetical protein
MPYLTRFVALLVLLVPIAVNAQCQSPGIDPLDPGYRRSRDAVTISGYVPDPETCNQGSVYVYGEQSDGSTVRYVAETDDGGNWRIDLPVQPFGVMSYYSTSLDETTPSDRVTVTVVCNLPEVLTPDDGQTLSTRRPFITGYVGCPFITLVFSQAQPGGSTITTRSNTVDVVEGEFSVQPNSLPNGVYDYFVTATTDGQGSDAQNSEGTRQFTIDSAEPESSVSRPIVSENELTPPQIVARRRSNLPRDMCQKGEAICKYKGVGGKSGTIQYKVSTIFLVLCKIWKPADLPVLPQSRNQPLPLWRV